ncbi:MAG: methyl-accepting chemotaxis protein [Myxococcota bacterium]|nr:methyl-accepting chemotaxis protein [Myxococcota bacterium]
MVRKEFAWQAVLQFVMGVVAICSWIRTEFLVKTNQFEAAAYYSIFGLQLFVGFSMLTTYGNSATLLLTSMSAVVYATMFNQRQLSLAFGMMFFFYTLSELSLYLQWWSKMILTPKEVFFRGMLFFIFISIGITMILRIFKRTNEQLLNDTQLFASEQQEIVVSASQLGKTLDLAVNEIEGISAEVSQRSSAQSSAIEKIDQSITALRDIAQTSFGAASDTRKAVFKLQDSAKRGNERLREVESRFDIIVNSYGHLREQFDELSSQAVRIEGILRANREIAAQIRILAVNAAIQAAKAGAYGSGFGMVAFELKAMIQRIEASLAEGRTLLSDIRVRAKESAAAIEQNTGLLNHHAAELEETTRLIDSLEKEFTFTASKMAAITSATESQGDQLDVVASGVADVELSTAALNQSTSKLEATVEQIVKSHGAMSQMLGSSKTSKTVEETGL